MILLRQFTRVQRLWLGARPAGSAHEDSALVTGFPRGHGPTDMRNVMTQRRTTSRLVSALIALLLAGGLAWEHPGAQSASLTGDGLTITGRLTRDSFSFSNQAMPQWNVELTYTNKTKVPIALGDSLMLLVPSTATTSAAGVHITREQAKVADDTAYRLRHLLAWGITVPVDGSTFWAFSDLMARPSATALIESLTQTPVKAIAGGGFGPVIEPGGSRTVTEHVLFPFDSEIKGERDVVVVVPPVALIQGRVPAAVPQALVFDVTGVVTSGQSFEVSRIEQAGSVSDMEKVILDTGQPLWRRALVLNWLAETFPAEATRSLSAIATDAAQDEDLRLAAVMNGGLWHIPQFPEVLLKMVSADSSDRVKRSAIWALGRSGESSSAGTLMPLMTNTDDGTARLAIEALARLHHAPAESGLTAALLDKKRPTLRDWSAEALVVLGTESSQHSIVAWLQDRKTPDAVRQSLIEAVGRVQPEWAVSPLAALTTNEQDKESLRLAALSVLSRISDRPASVAAIRSASASSKKKVREAAVSALQRIERQAKTATP